MFARVTVTVTGLTPSAGALAGRAESDDCVGSDVVGATNSTAAVWVSDTASDMSRAEKAGVPTPSP